jgi:hypothetical protein
MCVQPSALCVSTPRNSHVACAAPAPSPCAGAVACVVQARRMRSRSAVVAHGRGVVCNPRCTVGALPRVAPTRLGGWCSNSQHAAHGFRRAPALTHFVAHTSELGQGLGVGRWALGLGARHARGGTPTCRVLGSAAGARSVHLNYGVCCGHSREPQLPRDGPRDMQPPLRRPRTRAH